MTAETWAPISSAPGYEASTHGRTSVPPDEAIDTRAGHPARRAAHHEGRGGGGVSGDSLTPEVRAAILDHVARLVADAPRPTDEQIAVLRRWFAPDRRRAAA